MSERRLVVLICVLALFGCANGFRWSQHSGFSLWDPINNNSTGSHSSVSSWLDIRVCQLAKWRGRLSRRISAIFYGHKSLEVEDPLDTSSAWVTKPEDLYKDSRLVNEIPKYVLEYAPLVHLYSQEKFWPCDIAEHLFHVTPNLNYTPTQSQVWNLTNLDKLNIWDGGRFVYLTSNDNVEERPDWLSGQKNIPDIPGQQRIPEEGLTNTPDENASTEASNEDENTAFGDADFRFSSQLNNERISYIEKHKESSRRKNKRYRSKKNNAKRYPGETTTNIRDDVESQDGGRSDAPAVLIVVDKGNGIVDAFWFFFYSYNLGNKVFNIRFGNHIGDWEHTLVRFQHGKPKHVFFSEHNFGSAYSYMAVEKIGKRPVAYSAVGTHAMYATPGFQPYILPFGILHDQTDRGPLWDPLYNSHMYTYNHSSDILHASNITPHAPVEWFYFAGHWGDKVYPLNDKRQYQFVGQYHYVSGPLGPRFKNLGRRKVCQGRYRDPCVIKNWLAPITAKYWDGMGDGEEHIDNNGDMTF